MTVARVCRRHNLVCDDPVDHASEQVVCPRGHVVKDGGFDVVRLEDGHVVHGGKGMKTICTRRFTDAAGNGLLLQVTTGKRAPYIVKAKHSDADGKSQGAGQLARAGEEELARKKLDDLAEQALVDGWTETMGRADALTSLPKPVLEPKAASSGGGASKRRQIRAVAGRR